MGDFQSWDTTKDGEIWEPDADYDDHGKNSEPFQTFGDILFDNQKYTPKTYNQYTHHPYHPSDSHGQVLRRQPESDSEEDAEGNPKTFKRVLVRFAERTSMQGVPYIHVSNVWYAKAGWGALFLIGLGLMIGHLYMLFAEFYDFETHSTVALGFSTLAFPAVTICNVNPIKNSKLYLASDELISLIDSVQPANIAVSMEEERNKEGPDHNNGPSEDNNNQQNGNSGGGGGGGGGGGDGGGNDPNSQDQNQPPPSQGGQESSGAGSETSSKDQPANSSSDNSVTSSSNTVTTKSSNPPNPTVGMAQNGEATTTTGISDKSHIGYDTTMTNGDGVSQPKTSTANNNSGNRNNNVNSGSGSRSNSDIIHDNSNNNNDNSNNNNINRGSGSNTDAMSYLTTKHQLNGQQKSNDQTTSSSPVGENLQNSPTGGETMVQSTTTFNRQTTTPLHSDGPLDIAAHASGTTIQTTKQLSYSSTGQDVIGQQTTILYSPSKRFTGGDRTVTTTITTTTTKRNTSTPLKTQTSLLPNEASQESSLNQSSQEKKSTTSSRETTRGFHTYLATTPTPGVFDTPQRSQTSASTSSVNQGANITTATFKPASTFTKTTQPSSYTEGQDDVHLTSNDATMQKSTSLGEEISKPNSIKKTSPASPVETTIPPSTSVLKTSTKVDNTLTVSVERRSTVNTRETENTPPASDAKTTVPPSATTLETTTKVGSTSTASVESRTTVSKLQTGATTSDSQTRTRNSSQQFSGKPSQRQGALGGGGGKRRRRSLSHLMSKSISKHKKKRVKRFIDGFTINETNTRYQDQPPKERDGAEEDDLGDKSTIRQIEDEFTSLFTAMRRDVREEMGHQFSDMLMECTFKGFECGENNTRLVQTAEYGNCYTLGSENFISTVGGPRDGLNLIFFTQDEEYIKGITNSLGFQIHIHGRGALPNPFDEGLSVPAGMETFIGLKQVNIEREKAPYGECLDGDRFQNDYKYTYTQKTCQKFCLQMKIMESCQCFDIENEEIFQRIATVQAYHNQSRPCETTIEIECLRQILQDNIDGRLTCNCPSPCSETLYTKSLSSKQWPSSDYATVLVEYLCSVLNETECQEYAEKSRSDLATSFLKIVIYFEDLNYENITEQPNYETFQFVSDVGGTIGLWIGLSMISFFEVLQFFYECLHYFLYMKPKLKKLEARRRKTRERKQAARHAIRFANDLRPPSTMTTASSKLARSKSLSSTTGTQESGLTTRPVQSPDSANSLSSGNEENHLLRTSKKNKTNFDSLGNGYDNYGFRNRVTGMMDIKSLPAVSNPYKDMPLNDVYNDLSFDGKSQKC